jgi:hypothetical protein
VISTWQHKTLEFQEKGRTIKLQGLLQQPMELTSISTTKVYNSTKGDDVWAFVLLDYIPDSIPTPTVTHPPQTRPNIKAILEHFKMFLMILKPCHVNIVMITLFLFY